MATGSSAASFAIETGQAFLRDFPSVDIHAHPGRFFFFQSGDRTELERRHGAPFARQRIAEMSPGSVTAAVFSMVGDHLVLGLDGKGLSARRAFQPHEAISDFERQIGELDDLVAASGLHLCRDAGEVIDAHAHHQVGCIYAVEGGDFIEDRIERIGQAADRGVRQVTLIHYRVNQIGDTQTESPVHNGLTELGCDIIREMNKFGILIDLTHATLDVVRQAADVSAKPMLISHSNVARPGDDHARLISLEHARLVTTGGGLIGATPAGFGQSSFPQYIDTILRMIDSLGIDHVAVGTDMDFTYRPVFTSYRDWPAIPAALLDRGLSRAETAKVMGGNYLRLLSER